MPFFSLVLSRPLARRHTHTRPQIHAPDNRGRTATRKRTVSHAASENSELRFYFPAREHTASQGTQRLSIATGRRAEKEEQKRANSKLACSGLVSSAMRYAPNLIYKCQHRVIVFEHRGGKMARSGAAASARATRPPIGEGMHLNVSRKKSLIRLYQRNEFNMSANKTKRN